MVAQSHAEAEFIAATTTGSIEVFVDNQVDLAISLNPVFHGRTEHFKVKYYMLREVQKTSQVKLKTRWQIFLLSLSMLVNLSFLGTELVSAAFESGGEC
ncbi:Retrovirus-related Pol polyprotein from transposon TNT 1-94 [Gossypium australe]|uniref:Retrovirus-related Pol polyprotein from transposon TNT 1-94 n=1 Tax=Gossypium australe TaxID=47621 RepID=A0A5B6WFM3_9ROSI|nr:Retrovirus-related Pol polyprotein from transposon TNT 1-94 [Gossypium australe]